MQQPDWYNPLQQHIQRFVTRHQVPGLAIAVARDGQHIMAEGFGWRDVERELPVTPETIFGVASVTKSFAALAIMLLDEAGALSVDDPVVKWLPTFQAPNAEWGAMMRIHHLLTHTSGLPGMKALFQARAGSIRQDPNWQRLGLAYDPFAVEPIETYQELIQLMADSPYTLLGPPGTHFNYSNEGYALLQGIIEVASGQPFLTFMQERILDPLGMDHSTFVAADLAQFPEVTELYSVTVEEGRKTIFHAPHWWDVGRIYTNGSLKSTVGDLLTYMELYRNLGVANGVRIASEETIRRMITPHVTLPTGRRYGYGLDVHPDYHGVTLVGHSGGVKGVSAHVSVAVEAGITTAVVANVQGVPVDSLSLAATNALLGLPLEEQKLAFPTFDVAPEELARFVGLYRSEEGGAARIALANGALSMQTQGQNLALRAYAADGFVTLDGALAIRFLAQGADVFGLFMGSRVLARVGS